MVAAMSRQLGGEKWRECRTFPPRARFAARSVQPSPRPSPDAAGEGVWCAVRGSRGLTPAATQRRTWRHPILWVALWGAVVVIAMGIFISTREMGRMGEIARHEMTLAPQQGEPGLQVATITFDVWRKPKPDAVRKTISNPLT